MIKVVSHDELSSMNMYFSSLDRNMIATAFNITIKLQVLDYVVVSSVPAAPHYLWSLVWRSVFLDILFRAGNERV